MKMKRAYRRKKISSHRLWLLNECIKIIEEYQKVNIVVTLRQLFYQLVTRNLIPNTVKEYKKLTVLITDARYAGYIDWDAIEDRIRRPYKHPQFDGIPDLMDAALDTYRSDWWADQENYVELWCEKDALASVLTPIIQEVHVTLSINRGYTSASAIHDSALRVVKKFNEGKRCHVLYLGDHDPSGLDMVRDIQDRLDEITLHHNDSIPVGDVTQSVYRQNMCTVKHIALTFKQVQELNPPPNPAKVKDPRARKYISEHGTTSWEVDALPPEMMMNLVRDSIEAYINDWSAYGDRQKEDKENKAKLKKIFDENWKEE